VLAAIIRFSLRRSGVVLALAVLAVAHAVLGFRDAGLDIFPEFSPKLVIVQTEAPGYSAEQVELLVTRPLEAALSGILGMEYLRSESIQGLSVINVFFTPDAELYRSRQLVSERLASVATLLPPGAGPAAAVPLASSSATLLTIGVTSRSRDLMALRDLVDTVVVPRILGVRGVADVNVFGGELRQLQVRPRPEALLRAGLGLDDVLAAARDATGILGTGFIENANQRMSVSMAGLPSDPASLARVTLSRADGLNVALGDVADVGFGAAPQFGAASIMGQPGIVMMIIGQLGANTLTVSRSVEAVLADLEVVLARQGVTLYPDLFRPANYIETSLHNIAGHLLVGGLFVVIVLFLFLYDLRTAFISALAIPLSLLGAVIVLLQAGVNINVMVLGGLAIALGEVVDDAIIDTENIFRRLRENHRSPQPLAAAEIVFRASMEVRGSVVFASFIVALVFVPLLTLGGVAGRLFAPLGYSYILAIMVSLLVALTVTPALCLLLLARGRMPDADAPLIRALRPRFRAALRSVCRQPLHAYAATTALLLLALAALPFFRTQFLPELREGHYIVHTASVPGTSLEESIRIGNQLTRRFLQIPGVRSVSQWAGRAERSADTFGSHYSEFEVDLDPMPGAGQQAVLDALREILGDFPGLLYEVNTFLVERVDETISGYTSPVVVNLYGSELEQLDRVAARTAEVMRSIDGARAVQVRSHAGATTLEVRPRAADLARFGLRPLEVSRVLRTAFEGAVVGTAARGGRVFDVSVILPPALRRDPGQVAALPLRTPAGAPVRLGDVADVAQVSGRYNILHQGGQRLQTVTAQVDGRDLGSFYDELRRRVLEEVDFGTHATPEFTGAALERVAARNDLLLHGLVAGVLVLLLIQVAVGSARHALLILLNLPFALIGGVGAALLSGATVSVGSLVGFVTLFGITVRNSIMLVSHYRHLVEDEGCSWDLATALRGAEERLPSILMTGLVTALAMLPIALDSDNAGREIMGPMAAIIIGGLASSTLLNLLIMPAVLLRHGRFAPGGPA
jgi:CzcA family heavy metal efflux pump